MFKLKPTVVFELHEVCMLLLHHDKRLPFGSPVMREFFEERSVSKREYALTAAKVDLHRRGVVEAGAISVEYLLTEPNVISDLQCFSGMLKEVNDFAQERGVTEGLEFLAIDRESHRLRLEALSEAVTRLTLTHAMMQRHLFSVHLEYSLSAPEPEVMEVAARFRNGPCAELSEARDRFFEQPSPEHLEQYVNVAAQVHTLGNPLAAFVGVTPEVSRSRPMTEQANESLDRLTAASLLAPLTT